MAKIRKTQGFKGVKKVLPTGIEDVYFRNLGFDRLAELQRMSIAEDGDLDEGKELVDWIFLNLVCDEQGDDFDDLKSSDDISDLPISFITDVVKEANRVLGEQAGNQDEQTQ